MCISVATRSALVELKDDLRNRYEEMKQHVDMLEKKVDTMENKLENLTKRVIPIIRNICTTLWDPKGSQGEKWESYWQEQVKTLPVHYPWLCNSSK